VTLNLGGLKTKPWVTATVAGAAAVIAIGVTVIATHSSGGQAVNNAADNKPVTVSHPKSTVKPVTLLSVSPSDGSSGVNGTGQIVVTYSGKLIASARLPTVSPHISGQWQISGHKAIFTPMIGYRSDTRVTVRAPSTDNTSGGTTRTVHFTTGQYSQLRLEQLLSQLGYLPLTWTPSNSSGTVASSDEHAQLAAAYSPPAGSFSFNSGYPSSLTSQWQTGSDNIIVQGAVRTFEFDHNMTMDGIAGPEVWRTLLSAVANHQTSSHGYTYVWVTQSGTEHLVVYHDGHVALTTDVNTGIAGRGTADGTYPVYERFQVTQMRGTNPDGSKYDDTVRWVSYFNGGDAVHYFPRGGYGYYQSLGCVELPYDPAVTAYNLMYYGNLVTVVGPES
jgi:peptidoglycan hydrolase-like protein with peptidoglycan-binding domain